MTTRAYLMLSLTAAMMLSACKDKGPPPPEIKFPVGAGHYRYLDINGQSTSVDSPAAAPPHVRDLLTVRLGERTETPPELTYVYAGEEPNGRFSIAKLTKLVRLKRDTSVAWDGYLAATDVWERAMLMTPDPPEHLIADGSARAPKATADKPRPRRRVQSIKVDRSSEDTNEIEIISLGLDTQRQRSSSPSRKRPSRVRQNDNVSAPHGWRTVTMYSAHWCRQCDRAREWMDRNRVAYRELDIDASRLNYQAMLRASKTVGRSNGGVPTFEIGPQKKVLSGWNPTRFVHLARR